MTAFSDPPSLLTRTLLCGFCLCLTSAAAQESDLFRIDPDREQIFEGGDSPDGKWELSMPRVQTQIDWEARHAIVSKTTGEILVVIDGEASSSRSSHGSLNAIWSTDSQRLLWIVGSKWSQLSVNYLILQEGNVSQINVYQAAVIEILARLRHDRPEEFGEAVTHNASNGTAYPIGFTIGLEFDADRKLTELPLQFTVALTSNPKGIEQNATLEATLEGSLNEKQALIWKNFVSSYQAAAPF